jgi:hypothetical protein
MLELPPGAQVTHAFLYWAASLDAPGVDEADHARAPGRLHRRTIDGAEQLRHVRARATSAAPTSRRWSRPTGSEAYRVGGVDSAVLSNKQDLTHFAGWWLAVLYYDRGRAVLRNLALFDGLRRDHDDSSQDDCCSTGS